MSDRSDFDRDYAAFQHDQTVGVVSPGEVRRLLGVAVSLLSAQTPEPTPVPVPAPEPPPEIEPESETPKKKSKR